MLNTFTIARPYAVGAFKAAKDANAIPVWTKTLAQLAELLQVKSVDQVVKNPMIPKADIVTFCMQAVGSDNKGIQNFLSLLAQYGRLSLLPDIHALFTALRHEDEKVLDGEVIVPMAIDDATLTSVQKRLESRYQRQIHLKTRIDPSLIGGIQVRIGNEVIDASLKTKLNNLTKDLLT
jgi:F-type H+-transporting ATPase subunit delta